jgi:hypothetical protein
LPDRQLVLGVVCHRDVVETIGPTRSDWGGTRVNVFVVDDWSILL